MYRNEWGKAESEFRRAIDLDPTLTRAQVNLGLALSKLGRFDDALAAFNSALPEADAYYNLGLMYRAQRRYADAERTFRRVLDMAPEFTAATAQLEQMARGPATTQPETTVVDAARETTPASETADPTPANPGTMPAPTASVAASEPVRHTAADLRTTAEAVANIDETDADTAPCPDVDEGEDPVDSQRALASAEPGPGGPVEPTVTIAAPARTAAGVSYRDRLFELAAALGSVRDEIECLDAVDAERQLVEASKPGLESKPSSDPGAALAKDAMKAKQRKGPGPVTRNAGATGSKPGGDRSNVNGQADSKWTETPWRGLATATGRTERSELYGPPAELAQDAALSRHELVDRPRRPDQVAPLPH
jgi:tetratricopeptide (TPR) repeat protein